MKIKSIINEKILNPTFIDNIGEFTINPYKGCSFGCLYCYVIMMKNVKDKDDWGNYVICKDYIDKFLEKNIESNFLINSYEKIKKYNEDKKRIIIGSTCDPYQPIEIYKNSTRKIIEVLLKYNLPFFLMTKSPLFIRDLNLFFYNSLNRICFTINDEFVLRNFEKSYSFFDRVISYFITLLNNIDIYIHFGPFFPLFSDINSYISKILFYFNFLYIFFKNIFNETFNKNISSFNFKNLNEFLFYDLQLFEKNNNLKNNIEKLKGDHFNYDDIYKKIRNNLIFLKQNRIDLNLIHENLSKVNFNDILKKIKINIEIINFEQIYGKNLNKIMKKLSLIDSLKYEKFLNIFNDQNVYNNFIDNLSESIIELNEKYNFKIRLIRRDFKKYYSEDKFLNI